MGGIRQDNFLQKASGLTAQHQDHGVMLFRVTVRADENIVLRDCHPLRRHAGAGRYAVESMQCGPRRVKSRNDDRSLQLFRKLRKITPKCQGKGFLGAVAYGICIGLNVLRLRLLVSPGDHGVIEVSADSPAGDQEDRQRHESPSFQTSPFFRLLL